MNSEQIQDFLSELPAAVAREKKKEDIETIKQFFKDRANDMYLCMNYISNNYRDVDLVQPITAQLLALYYKGGILRIFALNFVPCFIGCYLISVSKKQHKSLAMFETFFLAVYNEEILVSTPDSVTKKVEDVRIPSIRYPSIYHDPAKLNPYPEITAMKPGSTPSVLTTVRIGPFPSFDRFNSENKFVILSRLMKSVNATISLLAFDRLSRQICLTTLSICCSGFSFPETSFRARVLDTEISTEILDDFTKKNRQHVNSGLLSEILTGVYLSLWNGAPDLALRAIDAIHQRAQYEMLSEVLLVTNAIRTSLLDNPLSKERRDELMWSRTYQKDFKRKDMVTNASLRVKRMPEDIPIQPEQKEKEHSKLGELVEEGFDHLNDLKRRVSSISLHAKMLKRRKSVDNEVIELQAISEERPSADVPLVSSCDEPLEQTIDPDLENGDDSPRASRISEKGAFSVSGFRHMDSGGSSHRSVDHSN